MKVSAILKGRKDSDNRLPIQIRINEGAKRTFIPTGIKITKEQWDGKQVVGHPQAKVYNATLRSRIMQAEIKKITGTINKYPDADFRAYLTRCLKLWSKQKSSATITQFETEGEKFLAYAGNIKLSRITVQLLNDYKAYLYNEGNDGKPYSHNTVAKSFKNLRTVVKFAAKERVIENNPFDLFDKPNFENPDKAYLTQEQVDKIEAFSIDEDVPERLRHAAAWFVLGCYTGLRHSDMRQFDKKKHIVGGRLVIYTVKTNDVVGLPVNERLNTLLKRVDYGRLEYTNQKFNERLKTIGTMCETGISLTAHMSRHTFAVRCANAGISPEVTARLMGIRSLKTVAIYYRITNNRIDQEIDKIL